MRACIEAILEHLGRPAFCGKDGKIVLANRQAQSLLFVPGLSLWDLLAENAEAYGQFTGGDLCLSCEWGGVRLSLSVEKCGDYDLFTVLDEAGTGELRAMALTGQVVRSALNDAMGAAYAMEKQAPAEAMGNLQKAHFRILRTLDEITTVTSAPETYCRKQSTELRAYLSELMDKAAYLMEQAGRSLCYIGLGTEQYTMLDREQMTNAVFHLLSNAAKFSPGGSTVTVAATASSDTLTLKFHNLSDEPLPADLFSRYTRTPALEDSRKGLGLGIQAVRSVALQHGGSLLVTEDRGVTVAMTVELRPYTAADVHSAIRVPDLGDSGWDTAMVAMSDVLPGSAFEPGKGPISDSF